MSRTPLLGEEEMEGFEKHVDVIHLPQARPCRRRRLLEGAFWLGSPLILGLVVGLLLPTSGHLPEPEARISSVIGWIYFCAWSISFYPQALYNYRRKSVAGLSLDFQLLNLLGFGCYAVYNAALYWNPTVRSEYKCMHGGSLPAVHANDVFFALHAAVVTSITLFQCAIYDRGGQRISWAAALGTGGALATIAAYLAAVVGAAHAARTGGGGGRRLLGLSGVLPCGDLLSWLSFLYFLSYIKLAVSLVKYIPQVYLNYRRRSTKGWNMHNVALDFGGGLLSLAQLLMDGAVSKDWTAVTGNPVKFALGFASMFFDIIFFVQHWLLYGAAPVPEEADGSGGKAAAAGSKGDVEAPALLPVAAARNSSGSSDAVVPRQQEALPAEGEVDVEIAVERPLLNK